MSLVIYNGVSLPYPLHSSFAIESVYDDVGHVDWYLTKYDISVQCLISSDYLAQMDPAIPANATLDLIMLGIQQKLLKARQQLRVLVGTTPKNIIPERLAGNVGNVDARNGPIPKSCHISKLTDTLFLLTWSCTAHYWLNADAGSTSNKPTSNILYNRWTESQDIDETNFSVRRRNGKVYLRSDNPEGLTVDSIREQFAVLGVPQGFRRTGSKYTVAPDGLTLAYEHTDKEVFRMPPAPAFKAEGEYIESTTNLGTLRFGEVSLTLHGSKDVDQGKLVGLALTVAVTKLKAGGAQRKGPNNLGGFKQLDTAVIKVSFYDTNTVNVRMRVLMNPNGRKRIGGVGTIDYNQIVSTPFASGKDDPVPQWTSRGSAALFLQAAAYFDPTLRQTFSQQLGQLEPGTLIGTGGTVADGERG